ncbi:hypothetical protein [Methylobacterium radiotolerans]|uniref:hypothetical protein n=1 Tax=Methylobacterium radiotolerans TaxID=31998 RepID=UPI001FCEBFE9|nr:hypothetical protein [Methylobacterium radiotolerans]
MVEVQTCVLLTSGGSCWPGAPPAVAREGSRRRAADRQVPEASVRSVDRLFEPPSRAEGFAAVRIVDAASRAD